MADLTLKRTGLDSARREVVEEMDYLVYTYRKALPVTSDSHVRLRYEQGSTSSSAAFLAIPVQDRMFEGGEVTSGGVVVDKLDPEEADPEEAD